MILQRFISSTLVIFRPEFLLSFLPRMSLVEGFALVIFVFLLCFLQLILTAVAD